eukprot:TRINITY_DN11566_c0_g1_i4.p1 TRINITY_DN11566_c0_g1~~TRINITY_DN11566_c0_g1_i4.p1  ORF type:complete len:384 (+),score=65.10 TRINITY_DN11566_c0_g1_i4:59-1210(+)
MRPSHLRGACIAALSVVMLRIGQQGFASGFVGRPFRSAYRPPLHRARLVTAWASPALGTRNPYDVLGLERGASEGEVKAAFRKLAKMYHPDVPQTGNVDKFQEIGEAAESLTGMGAAMQNWRTVNLDALLSWDGYSISGSRGVRFSTSSSAAQEPWQPPPVSGRVDVQEIKRMRRTDLRKVVHLKEPQPATADTLEKVQDALATHLGVPPAQISPQVPLQLIGFVRETNTIGLDRVARAVMAMEEAFGIELLKVLVNTWIKFDMPDSFVTVGDMANFIQGKLDPAESEPAQSPAASQPAPAPAAQAPSSASFSSPPAPAAAPAPNPAPVAAEFVVAQYDCNADNADELSFRAGDRIEVIGKSNPDWWKGRLNGQEGLFPSNYV